MLLTPTLSGIAFCVLAFAALLGATLMLSSRNVVHAAYWLLECSVAVAGLIWFLGAEYVAIVQLLVYAGAVGILVVFTIMITLRSREDANRSVDFSWVAVAAATLFFGLIAYAVLTSQSLATAQLPVNAPSLVDFGAKMFSIDGFALPFEIASLVLTVALIAGVWWTKDGDD